MKLPEEIMWEVLFFYSVPNISITDYFLPDLLIYCVQFPILFLLCLSDNVIGSDCRRWTCCMPKARY